MFAWSLAIFFGVTSSVLGRMVAVGGGKSNEPLWMLGFGILGAILGAVLGGSMDIVSIIKDRTTKPKKDDFR